MKRILFCLITVVGVITSEAGDYSHLSIKTSDGTELSVKAESLIIKISDGRLIITNQEETETFVLPDLKSMSFMLKGDVNGDGEVDENDINMLSNVIMDCENNNNRCDINADDETNVGDITALVTILNGQTSSNQKQ